MENNKINALDNFLGKNVQEKKNVNKNNIILDEREGLIERVDKVFVTKDGKRLLREQY